MKATNEVFSVERSRNSMGAYSYKIQSISNPNQELSMSEQCFGDLLNMLASFADDCGLKPSTDAVDLSLIIQQYLRRMPTYSKGRQNIVLTYLIPG